MVHRPQITPQQAVHAVCSSVTRTFFQVFTAAVSSADCDLLVAWGRGEDGQLGVCMCCSGCMLCCILRNHRTPHKWLLRAHCVCVGEFTHCRFSRHFKRCMHATTLLLDTVTSAYRHTHNILNLNPKSASASSAGMGDAEDRLAPTSVAALAGAGISAIACGAEYSLAVAANQQRVYAWGWCAPSGRSLQLRMPSIRMPSCVD